MTTGLSVENSFSSMVSVGTGFTTLDPEERIDWTNKYGIQETKQTQWNAVHHVIISSERNLF